jgi:hypothetical protein
MKIIGILGIMVLLFAIINNIINHFIINIICKRQWKKTTTYAYENIK